MRGTEVVGNVPERLPSPRLAARPAETCVSSSSNSPPKTASTPSDRSHSALSGAYRPYAHNRADALIALIAEITGPASRVAVCIGR